MNLLTVISMAMKSFDDGHTTQMRVIEAAYDSGLADDMFSVRFLEQ